MAKFIVNNIISLKENENDNGNDLPSNSQSNEEDSFIINNNAKKDKIYKIGKLNLDDTSLTRAAIVKLSLLGYKIT